MKKILRLLVAGVIGCGGGKAPVAAPAASPQAKVTSTPAVEPERKADAAAEDESPIPIGKDDASWGRRDALVTLVEMTDLQCPFCAKAEGTGSVVKQEPAPGTSMVRGCSVKLKLEPST